MRFLVSRLLYIKFRIKNFANNNLFNVTYDLYFVFCLKRKTKQIRNKGWKPQLRKRMQLIDGK